MDYMEPPNDCQHQHITFLQFYHCLYNGIEDSHRRRNRGGQGGHGPHRILKVCFGPHTSMHWLATELVS